MDEERLEKKCSEVLDRMMRDDRYFLHVLIQAFAIRCDRVAKEHEALAKIGGK